MAKKDKKKKEKKPKHKIARQRRLPGVDDPKIESIHNAAMDYAEIRDERQGLTKREVDLKDKLHNLMKEHGLKTYKYGGVFVELVVEEETVKVRIRKEPEESASEESTTATEASTTE